jgi:hypothetical protein
MSVAAAFTLFKNDVPYTEAVPSEISIAPPPCVVVADEEAVFEEKTDIWMVTIEAGPRICSAPPPNPPVPLAVFEVKEVDVIVTVDEVGMYIAPPPKLAMFCVK